MLNKVLVTALFLVSTLALLSSASPAQTVDWEKPVAAVGVGAAAPDFTLVDQNGQKRTLSAERGKRPVVLVFFRGFW